MRLTWADTLTGVCILYMIAMHVSLFAEVPIYIGKVMYFFMPWFFFKSGMFFKEKNALDLLKKDIRRLFVPYVVFSIFGFVIYIFVNGYSSFWGSVYSSLRSIVAVGGASCNAPLWFLFVLIGVRQIHNFVISKTSKTRKYKVVLIEMMASFFAAMLLFIMNVNRPLWMANIFLGLSFFAFGYLYHNYVEKRQGNALSIFSALLFAISFFILPSTNFEANTVDGPFYYYILYFLFSICGIIALGSLFARLPLFNKGALAYLGKHSMSFYVLHWPIIYLAYNCFCGFLGGYTLYFILLLIVFITCLLLDFLLHKIKLGFLFGE